MVLGRAHARFSAHFISVRMGLRAVNRTLGSRTPVPMPIPLPNRSTHRRILGAPLFKLDFDPVIHRLDKVLLDTQVPLGGLNGGVAEQELDLFQLPSGLAA